MHEEDRERQSEGKDRRQKTGDGGVSCETRIHYSGNPNSIAWGEYYDSRIVYFAISL